MSSVDVYEESWCHWDESLDRSIAEHTSETVADREDSFPLHSLPPQLHPAVSLGMHRVSSCYLSIHSNHSSEANDSVADLLSLWETASVASEPVSPRETTAPDLLYHDILMNVFTFLDAESLAAFSATARRPNFEVFYFLQLQLQRALIDGNADDRLSPIAGVGSLSRLARLARPQAETIVAEFLDTNSTLHSMPMAHSLAYIRQVLRAHQPSSASSQTLASAALFITVLGTAATMMGASPPTMEEAKELSQVLFKLGFVGSLMKAASSMTDSKVRSEQWRRAMEQDNFSLARVMQAAYAAAYGEASSRKPVSSSSLQATKAGREPMTPNPYEHISEPAVHDEQDEHDPTEHHKLATGCVGAYSRAVHRASTVVRQLVKEERKVRFETLAPEDKQQVSAAFIDACCSDSSLELVKSFVQERGMIDVEGFYTGSDGNETCALHAAAFHNSCEILEFLCSGLDEWDASRDGGLCDVNRQDANGWTAMHFAAGANSPAAVQILAKHGADLNVEAANGYTPLQWAVRLQNEQVADELRKLTGTERQLGWIAGQPLSAIANRFFAMIPTH